MKSKTLTLLLLSMLIIPLSSCEEKSNNELSVTDSTNESIIESSNIEYEDLSHEITDSLNNMVHKNIEAIDKYFFHTYHSVYEYRVFGSPDLYKENFPFKLDECYNFQSSFTFINLEYNYCDIYISECVTEQQAIEYQSFLNNYYINEREYSRIGRFVFLDCQIAYLVFYGAPLEKDGFLYYELENGKTLLFGDVCNCENEIKTSVTETVIPNWVDVIGGAPGRAPYSRHNPNSNTLIISENVKEIKPMGFFESKFNKVIFPHSLKTIHSFAFNYNFNLNEVIIPESVNYIGERVFCAGNIFCEAKSKPSGWDENFAYNEAKVYYADEWEYDENGVPQIK